MKDIEIDFGQITADNIAQLKIINSSSLPVTYPDQFYKSVVSSKNETLNKYAYHNGFVIGAICCKHPDNDTSKLYIMTLGVLPCYRSKNVGTKLVQSVLDAVTEQKEKNEGSEKDVNEISLHVQVNNEDAIRFYERLGFVKGEKVENYYKRLDPPDCFILTKTF